MSSSSADWSPSGCVKRSTGVIATVPNPDNFAMMSHNDLRPSYESLDSMYSQATGLAIDRSTSKRRPRRPSRQVEQVRVGYEQGSTLPIFANHQAIAGARVPTRPGAQRKVTDATVHTTSDVSSESFEIVDSPSSTPKTSPGHARALGLLEGRDIDSTDFAPKPSSSVRSKGKGKQRTDAATRPPPDLMKERPLPPLPPPPPPKSLHHELRRGLGPETTFAVYDDDAVVVPEAAAVPYASNLPRRRPSLSRSVSNGFKSMGRKLGSLVRRGSDASKVKMVPGSLRVDERSYPHGPVAVDASVPVAEAQQANGLHRSNAVRHDADRYPNAVRPRLGRNKTSGTLPTHAPTPPAPQLRRVKRLNRETCFEDFIAAGQRLSSSSEGEPSEHSRKSSGTWATDRILAINPQPAVVQDADYVHVETPVLPVPGTAAGDRAVRRKPVARKGPNIHKALPPSPTAPRVPRNTIDRVPPAASSSYRKFPEYPEECFDELDGLTPEQQAAAMNRKHEEVMQQIGDEDHHQSFYAQVRKAKRMFDRPPQSPTKALDPHEQTIVDTIPHNGHDSWYVNHRRDNKTVDSFHSRIQRQQNLDASNDPAAALQERLERERQGRLPSRMGSRDSSKRTTAESVRSQQSRRKVESWGRFG